MNAFHIPKVLIILPVAGLLFQPVLAQTQSGGTAMPAVPQTLDEAISLIGKMLVMLPGAFINAFQAAWGVLKQVAEWLWALWDKYIWSWIQGLWNKFLGLIGQEIEKRKPLIQQELEKEKQEVFNEAQQEAQKAGQNLWERLKELIKSKL